MRPVQQSVVGVRVMSAVMTVTAEGPTNLANPVINGPYDSPAQHFELDEVTGSPTGTLVPGRRPSESWTPLPAVKKGRKAQAALDFDSSGDRREINSLINDIRREVELWRARNYPGATAISRKLMLYWADPDRENRVLFCQREAAEKNSDLPR